MLISKLSPNQKGFQQINEKMVLDVLVLRTATAHWNP
jgi:hypothetical protein